MLKILDKYIIKKFLFTFFFMLGVIMLLAMVFDLSERLSEFIDNNASIWAIITGYYLNFIVYYGNLFSPMIIFISVIWFTAKLAQDTEIIPMLNSGRPFIRFLRPYMIAATFLALVSLVMNHFILPLSNQSRLDFEEKYYRDAIHVENYFAEFPGNQIVYFKSYTAETGVVNDLTIEQWDKNNDSILKFLKARSAVYLPEKKCWQLQNFYENIHAYPNARIYEGEKKDTNFNFILSDVAQRENVSETMTYYQLKKYIEREKAKGSPHVNLHEITFYKRTSMPFATYVLTIIGVSVSSRKKRGGIGVNIAIGLGIIFVYIFAMQVTDVAAMNIGFPPYIAVWVPNAIFAIIAYVLYKYAQK
jgi:lipopolysaccharide export system permease protein